MTGAYSNTSRGSYDTWKFAKNQKPDLLQMKKLELRFFANEPGSYDHGMTLPFTNIYILRYVNRNVTVRYCTALEYKKYLYPGICKSLEDEMVLYYFRDVTSAEKTVFFNMKK